MNLLTGAVHINSTILVSDVYKIKDSTCVRPKG